MTTTHRAALTLLIGSLLALGVLIWITSSRAVARADAPARFPTPSASDVSASPFCALKGDRAAPNRRLAATGPATCSGGQAAGYPCQGVDLLSLVPSLALSPPGTPSGSINGNDLWGWANPVTGREYGLVGVNRGTTFVDVTTPISPTVVGFLPAPVQDLEREIWRDVKVYDNHAFIVSEMRGHGMQVVDLGALPTVREVARYTGFGSAHNIAINRATGYAFATGTNTCDGGLHVVDIREPDRPVFAGCFESDGYTHDAQCVLYPFGSPYAGREICFAYNVDALTIVDVTDKGAMRLLSRVPYAGVGYTHQGWINEDFTMLLLDDEFDESGNGVPTTTYVWDIRDLATPRLVERYQHPTQAIDHNLYIRGERAFLSNYTAGLRILDLSQPFAPRERGYFDIDPASDDRAYSGAWSSYVYLPSGNILLNGIEQGLYVLRPGPSAVAPDFDLEPHRDRVVLTGASPVTIDWNSHALYYYVGDLTLRVDGAPPGIAASLDRTTVRAGESVRMTLRALADLRPGLYPLTLVATDGAISRHHTITIERPAPPLRIPLAMR